MESALQITDYTSGFQFAQSLFLRHVMDTPLAHIKEETWATEAESLDLPAMQVQHAYTAAGHKEGWACVGRNALYVNFSNGQIRAVTAGPTLDAATDLMEAIRLACPVAEVSDARSVPLWLWTLTENGPRKIRRMIDVPAWGDINGNYSASVTKQLGDLMTHRPESGRILLWNGIPGTGKSFALRSLAYEWRTWCSLHYIVDPDTMFGERASYLVDVLLDGGDMQPSAPDSEQWRLLVLEDTGELLTMDAKEHVGQALSRLLNVTDGLLGQGLRILVLVTTNEELGKLHPAIARTGRCASHIEFDRLSSHEAGIWLEAHGITHPTSAITLADLYGIVGGQTQQTSRQSVGFRR